MKYGDTIYIEMNLPVNAPIHLIHLISYGFKMFSSLLLFNLFFISMEQISIIEFHISNHLPRF